MNSRNHGGNTLIHTNDSGNSYMNINLIRFDDYVEENRIDVNQIGIIKMDIEDNEINALKGMVKTLALGNAILYIEVHDTEFRP
jgi:FkbM family methyltransferase